MLSPQLTLQGLVQRVREQLEAVKVETPDVEARRLVTDALKLDAVALIRDPDMKLDQAQIACVSGWLERRADGEPLARIRGWQEFYGRRFDLTEATLEPRADSETIIEAVLATVDSGRGRDHPWRILDVGTGTGCLAITLLAELPHATATATDISAQAIDTTGSNAQRLDVDARLTRIVTNLTGDPPLPFDFVVSNPPYIKSSEIPQLQTEVVSFDPLVALDGGDSGLSCYEELSAQLSAAAWGGHLFVEIAANDNERVVFALRQNGLKFANEQVQLWRDLTGHVRCVAIETRC